MADDVASAPPTAELDAASISSPDPSDLEPPTTRTRIRAILDAGDSLAGQTVVVPESSENRKRKSAGPGLRSPMQLGLRSPMQLTSSPGVNFLVKSAAVKKEALKKANMVGSPKTPKTPIYPQLASPSLDDLSPDTRAINSQASKRKRRKLISYIWKEADPIYKDGKLVEGKCIHCHKIFAASRDSGTSHMKRHLKVCDMVYARQVPGSNAPGLIEEKAWSAGDYDG